MTDLTNPIFHDEEKARLFFEDERWPNGVVCPFCNKLDAVSPLRGKSMGPGWYYCNACDQQKFTVRTGSVMERSHIPLTKWALGFRLMAASKKGVSAKQLERTLGVGYRAAWFMAHRIRECMSSDSNAGGIGGQNKVVEADETYIGGKAKNVCKPVPKKHAVVALVERGGEARAKHVADVTAKTLRKALVTNASRKSYLMTDEAQAYKGIGKEFDGHGSVNHSAEEYVRKVFYHTQNVESFFAIVKRGVYGSFHAVSEQHLQRYVDEFSFRWNTRSAVGIEDTERTSLIVRGAAGKRLTYRRTNSNIAQAAI